MSKLKLEVGGKYDIYRYNESYKNVKYLGFAYKRYAFMIGSSRYEFNVLPFIRKHTPSKQEDIKLK